MMSLTVPGDVGTSNERRRHSWICSTETTRHVIIVVNTKARNKPSFIGCVPALDDLDSFIAQLTAHFNRIAFFS
nr:hypothetical protein BgiMline_012516 [Biomphalaria glabrata]